MQRRELLISQINALEATKKDTRDKIVVLSAEYKAIEVEIQALVAADIASFVDDLTDDVKKIIRDTQADEVEHLRKRLAKKKAKSDELENYLYRVDSELLDAKRQVEVLDVELGLIEIKSKLAEKCFLLKEGLDDYVQKQNALMDLCNGVLGSGSDVELDALVQELDRCSKNIHKLQGDLVNNLKSSSHMVKSK